MGVTIEPQSGGTGSPAEQPLDPTGQAARLPGPSALPQACMPCVCRAFFLDTWGPGGFVCPLQTSGRLAGLLRGAGTSWDEDDRGLSAGQGVWEALAHWSALPPLHRTLGNAAWTVLLPHRSLVEKPGPWERGWAGVPCSTGQAVGLGVAVSDMGPVSTSCRCMRSHPRTQWLEASSYHLIASRVRIGAAEQGSQGRRLHQPKLQLGLDTRLPAWLLEKATSPRGPSPTWLLALSGGRPPTPAHPKGAPWCQPPSPALPALEAAAPTGPRGPWPLSLAGVGSWGAPCCQRGLGHG